MVRVEDPPREIPLSLQLTLFAHRDVTGSVFFLLPAAAALIAGAVVRADALIRAARHGVRARKIRNL